MHSKYELSTHLLTSMIHNWHEQKNIISTKSILSSLFVYWSYHHFCYSLLNNVVVVVVSKANAQIFYSIMCACSTATKTHFLDLYKTIIRLNWRYFAGIFNRNVHTQQTKVLCSKLTLRKFYSNEWKIHISQKRNKFNCYEFCAPVKKHWISFHFSMLSPLY